METSHKHLVIGAGFVGLGLAKCLRTYGITYDQVDADDDLGGNWKHGVYPHVHIISSRKTTEYPDFPMPADYPDFPSATQILKYLNAYADKFTLRSDIEFNKAVTKVVPRGSGKDQKWSVTFGDGEERIYKGVLVCNGHHWQPNMPELPGEFTGEYFHSKKYKSEQQLEGKRVLVVGGGNSACDITVDAVRAAKCAHISLKYGYWFLPKLLRGKPLAEYTTPWLPLWAKKILLKFALRRTIGTYEQYGLPHPTHDLFERHPTINSLLLYYLKHGSIVAKKAIRKCRGREVEFSDGSKEEYDTIISATGYHVDFPFLPKGMVNVTNNIPQLPEGTFHPNYKGLYIVGWGQVRYGVGPLVTAGSPALATAIRIQERLSNPLGAVLEAIGVGPPKSHLIDPMKALASYRYAKYSLRLLPMVERFVRNKIGPSKPTPPDWEFVESNRFY